MHSPVVISRGNRDLFFQQAPTSKKQSTAIPQVLLDVLVNYQPDGTRPGGSSLQLLCNGSSRVDPEEIQHSVPQVM